MSFSARIVLTIVLFAWVSGPHRVEAGAWPLPKGHLWMKAAFLAQDTGEEYKNNPEPGFERGERGPYRLDGSYTSKAVFLDVVYGLTDRLDVGVQLPWFRQSFVDQELLAGFGSARTSAGFSDLRGFLKVNALMRPAVVSMKVGAKAPTGEFVNQQGLIPTGEGQWDVDVTLQVGRSFWPFPAYANLDVGYRVRFKNDSIDRDPGDEWFWIGEVGYSLSALVQAILKYEGIHGKPTTTLGLRLPGNVQRITYLSPSVAFGPYRGFAVDAGIRFSLSGQNYPAGQVYFAGITWSGALP